MGLSLKPQHLRRYKEILRLFLKYGRPDLLRSAELEETPGDGAVGDGKAEELAADLERLGPTFVKLGQLLSTRADLLPASYVDALSRLQDDLAPIPFEQVEEIVSEELGVRISRAFQTFDPVPLASASLGQVHRATLRDGRVVAVKVQRPGIRERLVDDFEALGEVARFLDRHTEMGRRYRLARMVEEFRRMVFREIDYRAEANNLETLRAIVEDFDRLVVPSPIGEFTTARVLTMEYVEGRKVTTLTPFRRVELDGPELADQLFRAYLKQILVDGFLHADPHPGNVYLTEDGRLALLDLGMVLRLRPDFQQKLISLLLAISEGNGGEAASIVLDIAEPGEGFDRAQFERRVTELVARNKESRIEEIEIGKLVLQAAHASGECGVVFPPEIGVVGQMLLKLDHVARILAPDFRPNESIRRNVLRTMQQRVFGTFSLGKLYRGAMDVKEFVTRFPGRVNSILGALAQNRFEVRVNAFDEERLLEGFQKIANRITLGLLLAALIVGAALLTRIDTPFTILGYPGLSMLFFLGAALGAMGLALAILSHDRRRHKPAR